MMMMEANWHRCNYEQRDDGVYFCEGLHDRSAACEWEKLTVEHVKELAALTERVRVLEAALVEAERLSFAIQRTVASDPDNIWCREARILAKGLHDIARAALHSPPGQAEGG